MDVGQDKDCYLRPFLFSCQYLDGNLNLIASGDKGDLKKMDFGFL